ncbi:MAG: glycerophosphodiester phosphodiesterase family protein [Gammaproteobacteria bacterium]|nr:glycerophosphodiester phosphodiesterase family protein [Gammaproteobacteria bacterium]MDH5389063.1 glycerophosphodiester phosphodiesterase family protein [Gammaproteobacteria bacterium]
MADKFFFVGHRGQPESLPENSLESFTYVLQSGAVYIEADVQLTADSVVVLSHDENLQKMTAKNITVTHSTYVAFKDIPAGYPEKFSDRFDHCRIATLSQFSDLLKNWPKVIAFIEMKQESLACFGNKFVDLVMGSLGPIEEQSVLISFDYDALVYAREKYNIPLGWVLPDWSHSNQIMAERLSPEFLFVDTDFCPDNEGALWVGSWQWVAYTINAVKEIKKYTDIGIKIIETDRFSEIQNEYEKLAIDNNE